MSGTKKTLINALVGQVGDAKNVRIFPVEELSARAVDAKTSFDAGDFVGVSAPTPEAAQVLRSALGLCDIGSVETVGVEIYGVKRVGNTVNQITVPLPVIPFNANPDDVDHLNRAWALLEMLDNLKVAQPNVEPMVTATMGDGDPVNLFDQGIQYTNRIQWCLPVMNQEGNLVNCYYQIISKAQAVWVKDASENEYDYFFLGQYGVFSPNPGYVSNDSNNQGWYVTYYNTNTYPVGFLGNAGMLMAQNSPGTTQGQTTVGTSISETTGISIGFFGDQGTANFSDSVTIGTSSSYSIPDVVVANSSNSQGNNAEWSFEIPYVDGIVSLSHPVTMAVSTFQPVSMMLWQADKTIRDAIEKATETGHTPQISFATDFTMQYVFTYVSGSRDDKIYKPTKQSQVFTIPLPPKQDPPP